MVISHRCSCQITFLYQKETFCIKRKAKYSLACKKENIAINSLTCKRGNRSLHLLWPCSSFLFACNSCVQLWAMALGKAGTHELGARRARVLALCFCCFFIFIFFLPYPIFLLFLGNSSPTFLVNLAKETTVWSGC